MGARDKLNTAFLQGAIVFAALCGYWAASWEVFAVCVAILLGIAYSNGDIR